MAVYQDAPEPLERRLAELQAQLDQLNVSLNSWREKQDHLQPIESRLSHLTEQCHDVLNRWTMTGERHARVVGELEDRLGHWDAAQAQSQRDAADRIRDLQRAMEQEWNALRRLHEEPVKQLREQASTLTEVSVAAATTSFNNLERAEERLAQIEATLHRRLTDLSSEVRTAVAELRRARPTPALTTPGANTSWPLEGVVRLHNQLRVSEHTEAPVEPATTLTATPRAAVSGARRTVADRRPALDHVPSPVEAIAPPSEVAPASSRRWWIAAPLVLAALVGSGVSLVRLEREVSVATARAGNAERQAREAAESASQQVAAVRQDAARQVADARDTAINAQILGSVLSAPDLVRYVLTGRDTALLSSAQVLWSRSRGLVFSGSRLPLPKPNSIYQIWLLTSGEPVSAGTSVPDAAGRMTLATDALPPIPRPVTGITVTVEPTGGRAAPTGATLLSRGP